MNIVSAVCRKGPWDNKGTIILPRT